jgi:hypothetical protein
MFIGSDDDHPGTGLRDKPATPQHPMSLIMIDNEAADGPIPGDYSMVSFGAVVGSSRSRPAPLRW